MNYFDVRITDEDGGRKILSKPYPFETVQELLDHNLIKIWFECGGPFIRFSYLITNDRGSSDKYWLVAEYGYEESKKTPYLVARIHYPLQEPVTELPLFKGAA